MKRLSTIVLFVLVTFGATQNAAAQEFTKEVTVGWSGTPLGDEENLLPYRDGMTMSSSPLDYMFSEYDGPTYMTGNFIAEINFLKRKRWAFSVAFAANGVWKDCHDPMTEAKLGRISGFSATVMPQVRFNWINREVLKVYSSLGLGLTVGSFDDRSESWGSFQLGLLGIQVGRRFFVFGEAGCGMLYMGGKAGIGYRF
jgi:hypothetical protein